MRSITAVLSSATFAAAVLLLSTTTTITADARPSCEHCLSTGFPYFCKASITSQICFNNGDAQCDHQFCVCCKSEPMGGCMACEELDDEEWAEENLEQVDPWQSHELRKKIENEKDEAVAERNEAIGVTGGLTKDKLRMKREEERKKIEEERRQHEAAKKNGKPAAGLVTKTDAKGEKVDVTDQMVNEL